MKGDFKMIESGILSLLPPIVAIILCFISKRVLFSLSMGIFTGGLIIFSGNPFSGLTYSLDKIVGTVTDTGTAQLLIFNLVMGVGVAFIWRLGGSKAITDWAKKKIKTRKATGLMAWFLGIIVFFNDYANAAIVGNAFRDLFREMNMSSEELSYIADSTSAPVATFGISDWTAFQLSMITSGLAIAGVKGLSPFVILIKSIPYNLYCLLAIFLVLVLIITNKSYGPMAEAKHRAAEGKGFIREGVKPMVDVSFDLGKASEKKPMVRSFVLPIIGLVGVTIFGFFWTGRGSGGIVDIFGRADANVALLWGSAAMAITGMALAAVYKFMNLSEIMDTFVDGCKLMLFADLILTLANTIGGVTQDVGLPQFIIPILSSNIPYILIPVVIFVVSMFIAFSTGTSWGTMAIITPIAVPLMVQLNNGATDMIPLIIGVIFSGAIFGDHCSPISDTTVLSSTFAGANHMDHVMSQIPYAFTVAGVAMILYFVLGFSPHFNPGILLLLGMILILLLVPIFSKLWGHKEKIIN